MARGRRKQGQADNGGANIGFEQKLWEAADILRGNVDPSEYKHVVLGLLFLKYISDAFTERRSQILADPEMGESFAEQRDAYTMENIFWVPQTARWRMLQDNARQAEIGLIVDSAMVAIEQENPTLKGVLPKEYNSPRLDKRRVNADRKLRRVPVQ
jgi:type I restriction enzyme M protein